MNGYNTHTLNKLKELFIPHLKKKEDWKKKELEKKTWEILTTTKKVHTLVSEIKGHIQVKNQYDTDSIILWLKEGAEKIYVYQERVSRREVWQEILDGKYHNKVVFLDYVSVYKRKSLLNIRYEKK